MIKVSGHQHQCFPGGYNVKLYIYRGRKAWWLLAFLHSERWLTINLPAGPYLLFCTVNGIFATPKLCVCAWINVTRKYYPLSKQFRDPPTYTHQPSMQQKVPFSLIRCSSSKVAFCSCVEWGWHIYNIVESESDLLTRRAVDLFEKEPLKGNSEVHLHTPTKFGEDRSKDLGGDREQTGKQTDRQTDRQTLLDL